MSDIETGGPAFPTAADNGHSANQDGMTLRDYFIAHAPAEPQPWFQPSVPQPPQFPSFLVDMTEEERHEMEGWREYIPTSELTQPRVKAYAEEYDFVRKQRQEMDQERTKQLYLQWPIAWADAMLQARQQAGGA